MFSNNPSCLESTLKSDIVNSPDVIKLKPAATINTKAKINNLCFFLLNMNVKIGSKAIPTGRISMEKA